MKTKAITKLATSIARKFLPADLQYVSEFLRDTQQSILAYNSRDDSNLFLAVIAAEDIRFLHHNGFDIRSMIRALFVFLTKHEIQGASTIEQQLVRVVRQRYELSIRRKIGEIVLATTLAAIFDKNTILEMYVEIAYFGWRGNGIKQICQRLEFNLPNLNLSQAILIAALIKRPMPKIKSASYEKRLSVRIAYIKHRLPIIGGSW